MNTLSVSAQITEEEKIKNVLTLFFQGLHKGDTLLIKQAIHPSLKLQTVYKNVNNGIEIRSEDVFAFLNKIGSKNPADRWEEKLLSYNINIDEGMASVWTPYEFYLNDIFSHCGVNSFQLFKEKNTQWKIIYLLDSRRKQNCNN